MQESITFLHTSDLHLGAPFRGLQGLSPAWAEKLAFAVRQAYLCLIDVALEAEVDFVLIAGDIFDNTHPSYADYLTLVQGLERLDAAGIPVYCITGNHDPYGQWNTVYADLPPNTTMLSGGAGTATAYAVYERNGQPLAIIGGQGFTEARFPADVDIADVMEPAEVERGLDERLHQEYGMDPSDVPFKIALLHTGLSIDPTRAPTDPVRLQAICDYAACGHVHQPMFWPKEVSALGGVGADAGDAGRAGSVWGTGGADAGSGGNATGAGCALSGVRVAYSGAPQGRAMKESGDHGALLVTLTTGLPSKTVFVPLAQVTWEKIPVDISGCTSLREIQEALCAAQAEVARARTAPWMVVRFVCTGATPLYAELTSAALEHLRQAINAQAAREADDWFVDSIVNDATPAVSEEALLAEGLLPAVFLHTIDTLCADEDMIRQVVADGFASYGIAAPHLSDAHLQELAGRARARVLADLLANERGGRA